MVEFINVIVAAVCGFILGMAVHSAWLHSKEQKELEDWYKVEHK